MKPDEALGKLVAALEKIAPATWETLVAYQRVEAVTDGLICLVLGLIAVGVTMRLRRGFREETSSYDKPGWMVGSCLSAAVAVILLVICVPLCVRQYSTAEYHAIQELLGAVR